MKFKFAIPSFHRAENQRTLKMLVDLGFQKDEIVLSTQTAEDYKDYSARYGDRCEIIYKDGNCAADNRNTIIKAFHHGAWIMMLDDDIDAFYVLKGKTLQKIDTREHLEKMFTSFFEYTEKNGGKLWGIYPVKNAYFMKGTINKRSLVCGCLGIINCQEFDNRYRTKEDFEYCCRIMRSGANVIRFNFVTCDIKFKIQGGCHDDWGNIKENQQIAYDLVTRYPDLVKLNPSRRGEVLFCGKRD